jgi:hypothetical protein
MLGHRCYYHVAGFTIIRVSESALMARAIGCSVFGQRSTKPLNRRGALTAREMKRHASHCEEAIADKAT